MPMFDIAIPIGDHTIRARIDERGCHTIFFDGDVAVEAMVWGLKGEHVFQRTVDGRAREFRVILQATGLTRCRCRVLVDGSEAHSSDHKLSLASAGNPTWLWPSIKTVKEAEAAIRNAFWCGVASAGVTFVLSILPLFGISFYGLGLEGLLDVLLMAVLLVGLRRKSRICAVFLATYFIISKFMLAIHFSPSGSGAATAGIITFGVVFLNGARGIFAWHRQRKPEAS